MKFTCNTQLLSQSINAAMLAVSPKSTLLALEGILVRAAVREIALVSYNLEMGITASMEARVEEPGEIIIPAKVFSDIVRRIESDEVTVEADDRCLVQITGGVSQFTILGMTAEEFPELPTVGEAAGFTMPMATLSSMVDMTRYAIATNDTIERLSAHANKAAIFMRQGEFQKCVNTLTPIWSMVKQANYNVLMLKYLSPLLKSYLQLGKTDSIALYLPYADEASRSLAATSNGVLGILEIKADLLGQQKKYAEQWALLDSIAKLSSTNQTMPKDKLLATKAKCLHNMGKSAQAYQTMHEAYLQSDSLKQSDIDKQLSEFNVKYKTLEKEMQIEKMSHEQSLLYIRILWLILALIILLIAILAILYRKKLDKQRAELSEKTSYINGVENERKRLAKELHDGVCNDILAVNIMMQTNREEAERLLKNVGHNVRHLSHELIPPRFDNTSLTELVEIYCQSVTAEDGTIVKPFISTSFKKLTIHSDKALEIYRIIQECVSNAIKYGYSKMISVVLDTIGTQGVISVTNDLSPVHPITQSKSGIGKDTLKLRTDALQAELQVRNTDEEYQVEIKYQL